MSATEDRTDDVPAALAEPVRFVDERLQLARPVKQALRYVFPDHWSFLLGELALYSFVLLVVTGTFLALFFEPSTREVVWVGPYAPITGREVSAAYASSLDLSFTVPGGLLMRQAHHWAALLFVAAICFHLIRIFFTGAFRKPREMNYVVGVVLLIVAIIEGFVGYSLLDDLLSGMGLAIGYSTALSIPGIGGPLGALLWDGQYPGGDAFLPRLYIAHVFLLPAVLATLIAVHLAMIVRVRHSQFRGPGRTESNVVGSPLWPAYSLRALGLMVATAGMVFALGGLVQINPIWQWGPYDPWVGENGAQPDFYLGWLIGSLRIMPPLELHVLGHTIAPNPFFGGIVFPGVVFTILLAWPFLEPLVTRDRARHDLLDRPRDNPARTAIGAALLTWVLTVLFAGSADRVFLAVGIPYTSQVHLFRVLFFAAPVVAYVVARAWCRELRRRDAHPLRGSEARVVRRTPGGGFEEVE